MGVIKPREAVATNICWKSFILPHTENAHIMGTITVSGVTFLGRINRFIPK